MEAAQHLLNERLSLLIVGLLLGFLLFDALQPKRLGVAIKIWILGLSTKLNRSRRSAGTRVYRGIIMLLFCGALAMLSGWLVHYTVGLNQWLVLLELLLLAYLIPVRQLRSEAAELGRAVKQQQMARAKGLADGIARRSHDKLDASGYLRVAIEHLAENWNDKIVAAAFWYLVLGLPGLCLLRVVNLLDHIIGHRSQEYIAFGWAAAKLDDVMQYIPARLAGIILALAAFFIPKGKPMKAFTTIWKQAGQTASPNSGWPLAAMAGALNVSLCGPRRVEGAVIEDAWIGRGSARVGYPDFRRGLLLYLVAVLLLLLFCVLALALISGTQLFPTYS